jgi:hypothetical protein
MDSIPGKTISHYRIVSRLGEGGAAYKAEDRRSGLTVLFRFLPEEFSTDPQASAQFVQMADSVAALSHRHVGELYELGVWEGRHFCVTEFPDGETLAQRIAGHPVVFRELLDLAVQISDALEAAHSAGLIHGDLQPAKIYVTRQGNARLADFGVAGWLPEGAAAGGYQAPEQLRGERPDAPCDLFSLGAILYEMATGQPPFSGPDPGAIRRAILEQDVPPASQANPDLPVRFDDIVSKALEKDRDLRYQGAAEMRTDLRRLRRDWDSDRVAATRAALVDAASLQAKAMASGLPGAAETAAPPRSKLGMGLGFVLALVLGAAAGVVGLRYLRHLAPQPVTAFHPLTFRQGRIESARFGAKGGTIFYTAAWDGAAPRVFSVSTGSPESVPLAPRDAKILSVSHSNELAILEDVHPAGDGRTEGNLVNMALDGVAGQPILKNVENADWSPAGKSIAVVRRVDGKDRLEYPIGKVLEQTAGWIGDPRFLSDGASIAFVEHPAPGSDAGSVDVVSIAGEKKVLSAGWSSVRGLAWSPTGKEIWFTAARQGVRRLYAVNLVGKTRQLAASAGSLRLEDVAADGRALLAREDSRWQMAEVTPGQANEQDLSWLSGSELRDVSADGKTILFNEMGPAGGTEESIYVRGTDSLPATRLGAGRALAISPDGKFALAATIGARSHLMLLPIGAGARVDLPAAAVTHVWAAWLPGGKRFVFLGRQPGQRLQLFVEDVTRHEPQAISPPGLGPSAALSTNGQLVAAIGPDGKGYLYPVDGGRVVMVHGLTSDDTIVGWTRYGNGLYVAEGALPVKVFRLSLVSGAKTPLYQLAPASPAGVVRLRTIRVTPDGRLCVFSYCRTLSHLYLAEGLR